MLIPANKYTVKDFAALPEGSPYQLIDGELVMTPSPNFEHQDIIATLGTQLRYFVDSHKLGKVIFAPMDVYLTEVEAYQPDIIFISNENKSIIHDRIKGAPDLIVEVLSPSNAYYDLVHKKQVYETTGVKEYWIVDPMEKTVEIFENVNRYFQPIAKEKQSGTIHSKLLQGFSIELEKIF